MEECPGNRKCRSILKIFNGYGHRKINFLYIKTIALRSMLPPGEFFYGGLKEVAVCRSRYSYCCSVPLSQDSQYTIYEYVGIDLLAVVFRKTFIVASTTKVSFSVTNFT